MPIWPCRAAEEGVAHVPTRVYYYSKSTVWEEAGSYNATYQAWHVYELARIRERDL